MSVNPVAVDPSTAQRPVPAFSLSATLELTKGIVARGFVTLIVCSLVLLVAQVPPQVLGFAQAMSQVADERDPALGAAPSAAATAQDDEGSVPETVRKALRSGDRRSSARTTMLGVIANCFSLVWGFLVQLPLSIGAILIAVRLGRGESPGAQDILHGYRRLFAQLGALILQYLATLPVYAVAAGLIVAGVALLVIPEKAAEVVPVVRASAAAVGLVLILIALPIFVVGIWLTMRVTFCVLCVADPAMGGCGPIESIRASWRATRGHALELIVLFLLMGVVVVVTVACCLIPLIIIGLPVVIALLAAAWLLLMQRVRPDAPELIARRPGGSWGLPSQYPSAFDPSAATPPDFRA